MIELIVKREYRASTEIDDFLFFNQNHDNGDLGGTQTGATFLGKYLSDKKINFFLLLLGLGMGLLLVKSFYLQIIKSDYYSAIADTNRTREKALLSDRGLIYDSQKRQLVKNVPFFDALIMPKDLALNETTRQEQINKIAETIGINAQDIISIMQKYPKNFKYLLAVKEDIDYEQSMLLMIKAKSVPGLYIETRYERQYIYGNSFSHILGYEGKITEAEFAAKNNEGYLLGDYLGKTGVEASFEPILRGKYGKEGIEVDVAGHEKKVLYYQEPENGKNLILTIDQQVQNKIREILQADLKKYGKKKASVIMINPQNGDVLSLISWPDYDNNLFAGGISTEEYNKLLANEDNPLFDRAIKGEYPSGSTIKMVYASGALQDKLITDKTTFMSTGGLLLNDRWFFPDWKAGGHGATNVYNAIAWSINTFFYIIGGGYKDFQGLGPEGMAKYLKLFGFGDKTGIDLPGETAGLVPDPLWKLKTKNQEWFIGDTYHMAIGQGDLLVNPLQIANYTSALANGGILYRPHLVKEIFQDQNSSQIILPEIIHQDFISPQNMNIVRNAMRQTVTLGSAQYLNSLNVAVAGKTGTAQWSSDKPNHAWFTGFAPFDNPEVAITVLVEEGGEGSAVSVPITYDILNWYFNVYKKSLIENR
ncbi:MAG: penicillin-binding protein 2 [Candidatus Parcubacteria bacterium]|nr:penicillin-binding protein 2 [Candidatus Parcubacteria bacterium]